VTVGSDVTIDESKKNDENNPLGLVERCESLKECTSVDQVFANVMCQFYVENSDGGFCSDICKLFATNNRGAGDSSLKPESASALLFGASGESANSPEAMDDVPKTIDFFLRDDEVNDSNVHDDEDEEEEVIFVGETIGNTKSSSSSSRRSSFALKEFPNEIDKMFSGLNELTRNFVKDSNDVFKERITAYTEHISKLEELEEQMQEMKESAPEHKKLLEEILEEKAFLGKMVRAYSKICQYDYEKTIENHTVHFVADFGDASSNDAKYRPLKRWLMLPSTERVKRFMRTQVKSKKIVFSHDFGVFNAPTYGEGAFHTLRKWAKNDYVRFGYVPGKNDWIPAMVAYGLFRRLHVLVSAAALEFPSVRYVVFTGFDFNAVQNHYSGTIITSPKFTLHRTENSIVGADNERVRVGRGGGGDGGGLQPRCAGDANAEQQPEPLVMNEEDIGRIPLFQDREPHPRREEEGEGRGGGGGGGDGGDPIPLPPALPPPEGPPPVEPEVHQRAKGGIFMPFAEWTSETTALVTHFRVLCLCAAFKLPGSFAENQLVFFSVKAATAMREALGVLCAENSDDILGALEEAVNHETRTNALKLINEVLKGKYPQEADDMFNEIVGQREKHTAFPLQNADVEMTRMYDKLAERFPDSAKFFKLIAKWCPITFSAGVNVFNNILTKKDTGGDDEDDDENYFGASSERGRKKAVWLVPKERRGRRISSSSSSRYRCNRRSVKTFYIKKKKRGCSRD